MTTIDDALLAAQAAMQPVVRKGINQAQGWKFVEAADVVVAARKALNTAGLTAWLQLDPAAAIDPAWLHVQLEVRHAPSGDRMTLPMPWPITRPGDQGRRAAWTYARKQALIELLLVADPDEDPETRADPEPPAPKKPAKATIDQLRTISAMATNRGIVHKTDLMAWLSMITHRPMSSGQDLTHAEAIQAIEELIAMPDPNVRGTKQDAQRETDPAIVADPAGTHTGPTDDARPDHRVGSSSSDRPGRASTTLNV